MGAAGRTNATVAPPGQSDRRVDAESVPALANMNLQSLSDHVLSTVNHTATVIGVVAAAFVLVCLCLMYLSGTELTGRIRARSEATKSESTTLFARERLSAAPGNEAEALHAQATAHAQAAAARMAQLETELAAARRSREMEDSKVAQLESQLTDTRRAEETKTSRLAQLEGELATARQTDEAKNSRVSQLETALNEAKNSGETKTSQLVRMEAELKSVRQAAEEKAARLAVIETELKIAQTSADQAQAETRRIESTQGPRSVTPPERAQFLDAVRGMATGKVLVSAFFENKETHAFGADLLALFKLAGFEAVERTPVNFFTTSRPSSGIRIGCRDLTNPPAHFATVRKGFEALGLDVANTSIVNAAENDVVEIQITPRQ